VQGLSLVELMIALALGMIIILAIGYAYIGTRVTFKQQDALGRMQENARYVFETLSKDLRMSGFAGSLCGQDDTEVTNGLPSPADWDQDIFGSPVKGYEDASATAPEVTAEVYAGDALSIIHADSTREYVVSADAAAGAAITFVEVPADGNVVVAGCDNAKPRQAFVLAGGVNALATTIKAQSRIMPIVANLYYVRANGDGVPSLYRKPGGGDSVELAEGVEDMQITYGVDTSNPATCSENDGGVDSYVTADQVEATVPCATTAEDWKKVLSIRVSLLMRSVEDNVTSETQTYDFNGENDIEPDDRRLRKVFTTTIAVRNRL
jgi:type IV pilus assembly protein PilW